MARQNARNMERLLEMEWRVARGVVEFFWVLAWWMADRAADNINWSGSILKTPPPRLD